MPNLNESKENFVHLMFTTAVEHLQNFVTKYYFVAKLLNFKL